MSEFKVSQADLSDVSRKYSSAISKTGVTKTIPLRVNTNLSIARQSSRDISIIKQNISICTGEIDRLYMDLIALRNGIEAVRMESEEADRNAKRVFKPFSFGSFIRRLIDRLKELLDDDNSIITTTNNIVSKLREWSEQTEENQVIYVDSQVEPVVLVLNDPYPEEPGTVHEIERVTTDDVDTNDDYGDVINDSTLGFNGNNYKLADGVAEEYYYNQTNYDKFISPNLGYNVGCTATAIATACSIKRGTTVDPTDIPWCSDPSSVGVYNYAWDTYTDVVLPMGTYDKNAALLASYEQIKNGYPVLMRLTGNPGHHVTIIGVNENADPNNLSMSDFIIVDPADGTIKNLNYSSGRDIDTSWSLRIPK